MTPDGLFGDAEHAAGILMWILIAACIGSGMMAGLFCAFSTFMMKALASLADSEGMKAMQAINRLIVRPSFLLVFVGTSLLCLTSAILGSDVPRVFPLTVIATLIYTLACLVSTIIFNVPLNNRLDAADPDSQEGQAMWRLYLSTWTKWNHLRAVATLLSTFTLALAIARL